MTLTGFYPGSFDPVHLGHLDVIERALNFVDVLVIGVGVHDGKKSLFSDDERVELLENDVRLIAEKIGKSIDVVMFDDLTVDAARAHGAEIIIREQRLFAVMTQNGASG